GAGGVPGSGLDAVRPLHPGDDHVGSRALEQGGHTGPEGDRSLHEREHLPVRNLWTHRDGDRARGQDDAGGPEMSTQFVSYLAEPERYELAGDGQPNLEFTRREFFRIAGGGVVVALLLGEGTPPVAWAQRPQRGDMPKEIGAWLHVGEDNKVTVYTGKVEIGQNIRTSLTQVVAEELHAPVESIQMVMADTALVPYDFGTAGSQTTPSMASQLRRVAAAAREVLLDLAAEQASVERGKLSVKDSKVAGPDGKPAFAFGELTKG